MPAITRAIVRPPGSTFAKGLTSASKGAPDVSLALDQHAAYRSALRQCGVDVIELLPSDEFPDATFVEDVAVIIDGNAILTRPGAASRQGEVELMRDSLAALFPGVGEIVAPGTLDGGDICDTPAACYVAISDRTNEAGAEQLGRWLESIGRRAVNVDIRPVAGVLHLKTAIAFVGDTFVVASSMRDHPALRNKQTIYVGDEETYAADCIEINGRVFVAAGFPRLSSALEKRGFEVVTLEMSEFEKMDGGLSCLSLRF